MQPNPIAATVRRLGWTASKAAREIDAAGLCSRGHFHRIYNGQADPAYSLAVRILKFLEAIERGS